MSAHVTYQRGFPFKSFYTEAFWSLHTGTRHYVSSLAGLVIIDISLDCTLKLSWFPESRIDDIKWDEAETIQRTSIAWVKWQEKFSHLPSLTCEDALKNKFESRCFLPEKVLSKQSQISKLKTFADKDVMTRECGVLNWFETTHCISKCFKNSAVPRLVVSYITHI